MQFFARMRWGLVAVVLISLALWSPSVFAQGNIAYQAPVVAYVGADGNVYINSLNATSVATPLTGDALGNREFSGFRSNRTYGFLRWSPEGSSLAFVGFNPNTEPPSGTLYVANSGQMPTSLVQAVGSDFGIVWSPTGAEIGYAMRSAQPVTNTFDYLYTFYAVPRAGGQPRTVGTFQMQYFGEGAPLPDIADELILSESFPSNNGVAMAWLDTGLVHPLNAISNYGLAFSDFAGQKRWQIDRISNTVISPNRRYAVGRQYPDGDPNTVNFNVIVVDLTTGTSTLVASAPFVDAVGWTADSTRVLYSSANKLNTIPLDMTKPNAVLAFGDFPREGVNYSVALMSVPITGGAAMPVLSYPGRGFASISAIDNTRIAFSFVESSFAAVSAANTGAAVDQIFAVRPKVITGSFTLGAMQPSLLTVEARRPVISSAAVFIGIAAPVSQAPTPIPSCPGTLPSRMIVGKTGRVTPGEPNNLNTQPSPPSKDPNSQRLALIPAGGVFTVINGPVCGFGYTWWQVNYNGVLGWTAESGDGVYWLEPLP